MKLERSAAFIDALGERCADALEKHFAAGVLAAAFLVFLLLSNPTADPDLFARTAVGRLVETLGHVPLDDRFSFAPRKEVWVDHEWLSGVVFHRVAVWGGDAALWLGKLLIAAVSVLLLLRARGVRSASESSAWPWLLITVFGCAYVWGSTVRSQLFTYFFLPVFLWAFALHERCGARRLLLLLPLIMLVWVNAHGGFVVGLGLLVLYLFAASLRERKVSWPLVIAAAGCVAMTGATPYGYRILWTYILDALTLSRGAIAEWRPLAPFSLPAVIPGVLTVLIAGGVIRSGRRQDWVALVLIAASAFFGYRHQRLIAIYLMVAYVYGAAYVRGGLQMLPNLPSGLRASMRRSAAIAALVLIVPAALVYAAAASARGFVLDYRPYPVSACEFLWQQTDGGKVLVDFNNGSFVLWRLFPRHRVSLDGRYEELYPESTLQLVAEALQPRHPSHLQALQALNPDYILLDARGGVRPDQYPGWKAGYEDARFTVLGKEGALFRPWNGRIRAMWRP